MASGAQTIANQGLHHEPVLRRAASTDRRHALYTHDDPGTQVLDPGVGRAAVDVLKGVLTQGTGRRHSARRPPAGRQDGHPGRQHQRLVRRLHAGS